MKNARILVVEDDDIIADLIAINLTGQGCQVTQAEDGQAAWDLIGQSAAEFDAILLDRSMPRMDGLTLLGKLRARPETAQVPVILVTAMDDKTCILEGLQAGAYYYLTKPLQMELLLVVVRAAVDQSRQYRQVQRSARQTEQALRFLTTATFHYRRLEEVNALAGLLVRLCPQPDRVALGLHELSYVAAKAIPSSPGACTAGSPITFIAVGCRPAPRSCPWPKSRPRRPAGPRAPFSPT
jgi:DNA-binding response OmpR family regulator